MKRTRKKDGAVFALKRFDVNGPIRAEISVADEEELRELRRTGKLIAVRMEGPPNPGKTQPQVNLVPCGEIEDFDWK